MSAGTRVALFFAAIFTAGAVSGGFLPLFFAYAGLHTNVGLLDTPRDWLLAGLIIAVAVAGKLGGTAVAARATGSGWREAGALGVLMNSRGLMELVLLTIGLQDGVITPALFAMMVLMAIDPAGLSLASFRIIWAIRLSSDCPRQNWKYRVCNWVENWSSV